MNEIQLIAQAQPNALAIYEETYIVGERIVPKVAGGFTLYSILPIFKQDDELAQTTFNLPGQLALQACQVIWLAADDVAFKITQERNMKTLQAQQARAKLLGQS